MATGDPEQYLAVLKASYDYEPQSDDEIPVKEDQLLLLLERVDDDWWKVKVKGDTQEAETAVGLVPAAYVEQAIHTSVVKVQYDYEAAAPGELSVKEDEVLLVFDTEEDWLLVQSQTEEKAGYVPGNYVEATTEDEPSASTANHIVVPDSPPRPAYVDPADMVASSKVTADDIKTWSVSEIDKKGKKKKGTLGIGNGAVFFASESDKTPVQKWQTADVSDASIEKSKHVRIDIGGSSPNSLHFHAGSKDNAEAIVAKLESSKAFSAPSASADTSDADATRSLPPPLATSPKKASVHFSPASPVIIPTRDHESEEEEEPEPEPEVAPAPNGRGNGSAAGGGNVAVALYDFPADGEDELSVAQGEQLTVLENEDDEWWKCRNSDGAEGVVPASYLEMSATTTTTTTSVHPTPSPRAQHVEEEPEEEEQDDSEARAAQEAAEQEEAERLRQEEEEERQKAEKLRKKAEAQKRAKDAAVAAEAERKRRKDAAAAAAARVSPPPATSPAEPAPRSPRASSSSRGSTENARPPPEKIRIWHDRSGQFRVEAALLGFTNGKLRLHKVNGVTVEVPAEKMSVEDMRYVEKLLSRKSRSAPAATRGVSDDDVPLALAHPGASTPKAAPPAKKAPKIDWFDFFLSAGCDLDDCTRYAASFERDKIDETILPDITDATMRSLGLREGDIIRVTKAIEQRKPSDNLNKPSSHLEQQMHRDEELARQLQAQENGGRSSASRSPAPNLFAGPGGVLKNPRRGRPQPSKSTPPSNVDLNSISTASDEIQRTSSPQAMSSINARPASVSAQSPPRASSAAATTTPSGFGDDAWTIRPSSTKPVSSTPPAAAARAPSAPPPSTAPALAAPPVVAAPQPVPQPTPTSSAPAAQPSQPTSASRSLANTTERDIFEQLAALSTMRQNATPSNPPAPTPPALAPSPASYRAGLGMGSSPVPMGHLQAQPTGFVPQPSPQPYNGPRGPFAPVPANQGLLQPLIPTQTGFNSFVPTRAPANTGSPFQSQLSPPPFLSSQPTGMPQQSLMSQPTGMPQQPVMSQPTGMPFSGYNVSPFQNPSAFSPVQSHVTGFNPGMNQSPFGNGFSSAPPIPPVPPLPQSTSAASNSTNPVNVFAQMKSGTFAAENDSSAAQASGKYDALRGNTLVPQATGWGQSYGYTGYQH